MTEVTVKRKGNSKVVPIKDAIPGTWYVVHSYEFNQALRGTIGVLIRVWNEDEKAEENQLISTSGGTMNAEALFLQEIKHLEIKYAVE